MMVATKPLNENDLAAWQAQWGILDPEFHARLTENLEEVAMTAGVPAAMIKQSAKQYLSEAEVDWLTKIKQHASENTAGLALVGKQPGDVAIKMMAMASVLVRNYIDARVIPLAQMLEEGEKPSPTVLLIPNFYVAYDGKPLSSWQGQVLHSCLLERFVAGKQTVVWVQNLALLSKHYGEGIASLIENSYVKLES